MEGTITLSWTQAGAILAVMIPILTYLSRMISDEVKVSINLLRTDIEINRAIDKKEMQDWIDGSFMRSKEVGSMLQALDHRVTAMERIRGLSRGS